MTSEVKAALIIAGAVIITMAMWIYYWRLDQAEGF
jgi:hypothetical protein